MRPLRCDSFWVIGLVALHGTPLVAQTAAAGVARRAAIHPVTTDSELRTWLDRVPSTRLFPPDFAVTLRAQSPAFMIEMSTAPGCLPCADMWATLGRFRMAYGWRIGTMSREDALLRSGRLGLPWVGHPVVWVRRIADPDRIVPIAIGTDHLSNVARNVWLAAKILTGVRAAVGLRAMAKYTGIVGDDLIPRHRTGHDR